MDAANKQCLENLIKLTSEMGLSAKADHYQKMLAELIERLQQVEQDEMQEGELQKTGLGGGLGIAAPGRMTGGGAVAVGGGMTRGTGFGMAEGHGFGGAQGTGITSNPATLGFAPPKEKVDAPMLRVDNAASGLVQRTIAGTGGDDIWAGVNLDWPE
jgi:intraflagellar transport protein 88